MIATNIYRKKRTQISRIIKILKKILVKIIYPLEKYTKRKKKNTTTLEKLNHRRKTIPPTQLRKEKSRSSFIVGQISDPGTKVNTERSGSDIRGYETQISNSTAARFHDELLRVDARTDTGEYICMYRERRIRFGVKGQGTQRAARSIARESGSRRRPTFLSGHRSSRTTYFPSPLLCVSCVFVIDDLRRDE